MHRAAELQVAAQADGHPADFPPLAADGEHVGEGLGGVLVAAVPGVDNGDVGVAGGHIGGALLKVAHGGDVGVAGNHADGVGNALPLGGGAAARRGEPQHLAPQAHHGGLEAQTGAGAGLVEQGGQNLAVAGVGVLCRAGQDVLRQREQPVRLLAGEIQRVDKVSHKVPSFPKSSLYIPRKRPPRTPAAAACRKRGQAQRLPDYSSSSSSGASQLCHTFCTSSLSSKRSSIFCILTMVSSSVIVV